MTFEQLKAKGLVESVDPDLPGANRLMARSRKDLKTAQAVVGTDAEWAYVVAVHAILRAARALTLAEGLRPRGRDQTRTLLQLASSLVGGGEISADDDLEQIRKKGQHFLEWADRPISMYELEATLNIAEQWVGVVSKRIYAKDPQARLL
jgi:hypothetical protein